MGELIYNSLTMLQEIKELISSPFTKYLGCEIVHNEYPLYEHVYTLDNTAMVVTFKVSKRYDEEGVEHDLMQVFTQHTTKTLELTGSQDSSKKLYTEITYLKDIKEIINIIKTKFFPAI